MAVELNIDDVLTVRMNYRDDKGTLAFNVLHYTLANVVPQSSGVPPFNGVDFAEVGPELAERFFNDLIPSWQDFASSKCQALGATVQDIFPTPLSRQYTYIADPTAFGSKGGDMLPLQDSPTLVKRTAFGARWGIGRVFVPGVAESDQASGVLIPTAYLELQAIGNEWESGRGFTIDQYNYQFAPVLYGPRAGLPPRITEVTEIAPESEVIKSQRRRRPGKGI